MKVEPLTSIVQAPCAVGVNVAVYTVELIAVKALIAPLPTEISLPLKSDVAILEVNVKAIDASLLVSSSLTVADVIVIVGFVSFKFTVFEENDVIAVASNINMESLPGVTVNNSTPVAGDEE